MRPRHGSVHDAMAALKPILNHPRTQAVLCWLVAAYIRLVWHTCRWKFIGDEAPARLQKANQPFIIAFWHGRLFMGPYILHGNMHGLNALISTHRDGRLISQVVHFLGIGTVSGSTSRGGLTALRQAMRIMKLGHSVAITPDGPRGPRMRASNGIVALARLTGAPIFPVSYSTSRRKVLRSWDRFVLPLPFSRGVIVWGPAITVDADANMEALERARIVVEDALNETAEKADELSGQPVIRPESDTALTPATADR